MTSGRSLAVGSVAALAIGVVVYQFGFRSPPRSLAGTGLDPRNVAVLYFEDLSADGELGYVADGLTEGLISELRRVRALRVVSRNGVAQFRDGNVSRDSIARALGVGSLVIGSVEPEGNRVRVTAQLIDGESGARFDQASFALPAGNLLALLDSATTEVSRILRERLGEEIRTRRLRAGTANPEAWALVQRGERARKEAETLLEEDEAAGAFQALERADSILARAEAADPEWPEPIVLRGEIARRRALLAHDPEESDEWATLGLSHAARALQLDKNHATALALRGTMRYLSWYFGPEPEPAEADRLLNGAKEDLESAVSIEPTLASAHSMLSLVLFVADDALSANLAALRAYEEDAYLSNADAVLWRLFQTSYDLENFAQAVRWCEEGHRRFPTDGKFVQCQLWNMTARAVTVDPDEAWRLLDELEDLTPEHDWPFRHLQMQMVVAGALARAGLADSARSVLVRSRGGPEVDADRALVTLEAFIRTLLGDTDEALRLLRAYMVFNPHHRQEQTEDVHWWWRGLQDDPRYQALMRQNR